MNWLVRSKHLIIVLVTGVALFSCKKYNDDIVTPEPVYPPKFLELHFAEGAIKRNLFDSAIVMLEKEGSNNKYLMHFEGAQPRIDLDGYKPGKYTANILVFARVANSESRYEYAIRKEFQVGKDSTKEVINAPNGTITDVWKPRARFFNNDIEFVVSLDNNDPYFRVRVADKSKWKEISVERYANNKIPGTGTEFLAKEKWTCNTECFDINNLVQDSTSFSTFSNKVKALNWNAGEIEISAESKTGEKFERYLPYKR